MYFIIIKIFRVMKALGENGVPMPNLLALCEDER